MALSEGIVARRSLTRRGPCPFRNRSHEAIAASSFWSRDTGGALGRGVLEGLMALHPIEIRASVPGRCDLGMGSLQWRWRLPMSRTDDDYSSRGDRRCREI